MAELGMPDFVMPAWHGVFVPSKTPAAIKEKLYQEIAKALANPNVAGKLKELGADPMPITSAQYDALVKKEIETNSKVAKAANIKVN
jgi:tripartite-type tricarboxylate transporter receptor subunit TctC